MKSQDVYKEVRIFEYPGANVRVSIPVLTAEERAKRMAQIRKAAEALLKEATT